MKIIAASTKPVMFITGILTCTMVYALISPQAALFSMFCATMEDNAMTNIVIRSWGALISLIGAMLVYGAFQPQQRSLILIVAGVSKCVFVGLLLGFGLQYLPKTVTPIVIDSIAIALYAICLYSGGTTHTAVKHGA